MIEVTRHRRIDAGAAEVWAALADFGAIARWGDDVDHSCLMTAQTEGVGTTRRIQVGRTTLVERVVEWEPPTVLAYAIEGLPPVIRSVVNRWAIEPDESVKANGRAAVMVSLTSTIDAGPRPPQQVVARAAGRRLGATNDGLLAGLDAAVTAGRTVPT
jgi:uncharacterized protein YndB with AHSA1/START domain